MVVLHAAELGLYMANVTLALLAGPVLTQFQRPDGVIAAAAGVLRDWAVAAQLLRR